MVRRLCKEKILFAEQVIFSVVTTYRVGMEIKLKRAYTPESSSDGFRVYVDRLWPRGLSHENFHYDLWAKNVAPSNGLRHWFHENPDTGWEEFRERYEAELSENPDTENLWQEIKAHKIVTLLYSSHDEAHNNAVILADFLAGKFPGTVVSPS